MDILFPSFYSSKHASLVTVYFYDFFSTWAIAHLSLLKYPSPLDWGGRLLATRKFKKSKREAHIGTGLGKKAELVRLWRIRKWNGQREGRMRKARLLGFQTKKTNGEDEGPLPSWRFGGREEEKKRWKGWGGATDSIGFIAPPFFMFFPSFFSNVLFFL